MKTDHRPSSPDVAGHATLLAGSFRRATGSALLADTGADVAQCLYHAPFVLLSHGVEADPIFNYANLVAQKLFEMDWHAFTRLPSRLSAEPINQAERADLLARVSKFGFIDDYSGVRISSTGQRFRIEAATVWNICNDDGVYVGQGAMFSQWTPL